MKLIMFITMGLIVSISGAFIAFILQSKYKVSTKVTLFVTALWASGWGILFGTIILG